jgi:hypothetical protein
MTVPLVARRTAVATGGEALEALANARERLILASVELRRMPGTAHVGTGVDVRGYRTGSTFEMYVEAEFQAGYSVTWWIEITWEREWMIDATVRRNDDDGQQTLRQFEVRVASDPQEFAARLAEVVDEVTESIGPSVDTGA